MKDKLNFSSQSLLELEFSPIDRGYNPLEVDQTLDKIIQDYIYYEKFKKDAVPYIRTLESNMKTLQDNYHTLEVVKASYEDRLKYIGDNPNASRENIDYIKRIRALEDFLYKKGFDPSKIK